MDYVSFSIMKSLKTTFETTIDLIQVLAINPKKGNYYRVWKNEQWVYLNNLIIPINFGTYLQNEV
jgi:hypothetical protein